MIAYIDYDCCYYNVSRKLFRINPWTVIINRYNNVISVPHWLDGHFNVKKMDYIAPPVKAKIKVSKYVETFNIDERISTDKTRRSIAIEFLQNSLKNVQVSFPSAVLIHKDSIVVEAELKDMNLLKRLVVLPCTIGIGTTQDEAKEDCKQKKLKKKKRFINHIKFIIMVIAMVLYYYVRRD